MCESLNPSPSSFAGVHSIAYNGKMSYIYHKYVIQWYNVINVEQNGMPLHDIPLLVLLQLQSELQDTFSRTKAESAMVIHEVFRLTQTMVITCTAGLALQPTFRAVAPVAMKRTLQNEERPAQTRAYIHTLRNVAS